MNLQEYKEVDWEFADKDWIDGELQSALDALPSNKHRATIMKLAEASAVGRSMDETFKMKEVCAKKTWHGPYEKGIQKPGWKDNPLIVRALNLAMARVSTFQTAGIAANIKETTRLLATAAPSAVIVLSALMEDTDAPHETQRKAANDLLDRLEKLLGPGNSSLTLSETRTVTFDLSNIPMETLHDIIEG